MRVHCCLLDRECRQYAAPARVYVFTRRWCYTIALHPNAKSQKYPGDYERFGWVTRRPRCGR